MAISGETIILSDNTEELNDDFEEVTPKENVVEEELEEVLKESDEFSSIVVRDH